MSDKAIMCRLCLATGDMPDHYPDCTAKSAQMPGAARSLPDDLAEKLGALSLPFAASEFVRQVYNAGFLDGYTVDEDAPPQAADSSGKAELAGLRAAWLIACRVAEASADKERKLGAFSVAGKIHDAIYEAGGTVPDEEETPFTSPAKERP